VECYETCLRHAPGHLIAQSRLAEVMISRHEFAEAETLLSSVLAKTAKPDPALLHNLGLAQFHQRRFAEAEKTFAAAHREGLRSAQATGYLVKSLHQQGKTGPARELAARWLEMEPTDAVEGYLCLLDFDHGELDRARIRANVVLARNPDNPDAATVLAHGLLEDGDTAGAGALFATVQRQEPDNPRALLGLGLVAVRAQRHDEARELLEQAYALMPENYGTLTILGWTRIAAGDAAGAEACFRRSLELNRSFAETHGGLASALVLQDRREEARKEIKLAQRLGGSFGAGYAESMLLGLEESQAAGSELFDRRLRELPPRVRMSLQREIERMIARPQQSLNKPRA
jgi:Flp pilus assembly protein TadD